MNDVYRSEKEERQTGQLITEGSLKAEVMTGGQKEYPRLVDLKILLSVPAGLWPGCACVPHPSRGGLPTAFPAPGHPLLQCKSLPLPAALCPIHQLPRLSCPGNRKKTQGPSLGH